MKIITWNVNGLRACSQKGFHDYLRRENPDFLCLQETKSHPDQLSVDLMRPDGRYSYWSSASRKGYSGVVTYAKDELSKVTYGVGIRKFDSEGRFVVSDHGEFVLYNVYFPNGGSGDERHQFKQEFLVRFAEHLSEMLSKGREVILVGDYNVAYLDIDVYDPVKLSRISGFFPEERLWFKNFLASGFVDCFRHLHPKIEQKYTWWSYQERARLGNRGWRIDHICISKGLLPRLKRAEIQDDVGGSDHCPVVVELA